jgi:hypothetical protein
MKRSTVLFYSAALAAVTGSAFAGEDSTDRWHSFGPAWYEVEGGLRRFAAGDPYEAKPRAEAAREAAQDIANTKRPARQDGADGRARQGGNELVKPGV